jgi:antirestriction protein ArdC
MNASDAATKRDAYQTITDAILAALDTCGPFERPWSRGAGQAGLPFNESTKRTYRGSNVIMLWMAARAGGYATDQWATFKQWQNLGATVRKGAKGTPVLWFQMLERKGKPAKPTDDDDKAKIPCARITYAFNVAQVEGYEAATPAPVLDPVASIEEAERLLIASGARIVHGGDQAFYSPSSDHIALPRREAFIGTATSSATEAYYSTALHELTHWTAPRLKRDFGKRFGDEAYAAEELVAELGAAFLCATLGVSDSPRADHASYLAHWSKVLRRDKRAFITASSKAAEATDFLMRFLAKDEPAAEAA